jgi:hypothetical protein
MILSVFTDSELLIHQQVRHIHSLRESQHRTFLIFRRKLPSGMQRYMVLYMFREMLQELTVPIFRAKEETKQQLAVSALQSHHDESLKSLSTTEVI